MQNTIFVQIASYRDPQLLPTINDLLANADHPEMLTLSVCWQHGEDETLQLFIDNGFVLQETKLDQKVHDFPVHYFTRSGTNLYLIDVPYLKTKGACWARNTLQQLYNNEKYTLQLDSHHRFIEHWDSVLIDMLESIRTKDIPKPLLTTLGSRWDITEYPDPKVQILELYQLIFDKFTVEGIASIASDYINGWQGLTKPIPARFYCAHFCFADGSFSLEVQHDPEYFFYGEEINIAARAFTHGYDFFHPHRPILWHEYTRKQRGQIWNDHTEEKKKKGLVDMAWDERDQLSHKRNRILLGVDGENQSQIDFGKYGLGTTRTLREYEEYAGINFKLRGIQQRTLDKLPPPNNFPYATEKEWENSFIRSNEVRIWALKSELGTLEDDYDFFYVGLHDAHGTEVYRQDIPEEKIKEYLNGEWIDYNLHFLNNGIPVTYTIWPHSKSKGFMERIVKRI